MKRLAAEIRTNKEKDMLSGNFDFIPQFKKNVDFVSYFKNFLDTYTNKDVRIVRYSYEWFVKFLALKGLNTIKPGQIDRGICEGYLKFMQEKLNGETPYNYFTKFKRVVRLAIRDGLIRKDPIDDIKVKFFPLMKYPAFQKQTAKTQRSKELFFFACIVE
jgi:hypothetical protein